MLRATCPRCGALAINREGILGAHNRPDTLPGVPLECRKSRRPLERGHGLRFSVLFTLTGYPEDVTDAFHAAKRAGLNTDWSRGPGDYAYLAKEGSRSGFWRDWAWRAVEVTAQGVLNLKEFRTFIEAIGALPDGCETMGSLGGPLGVGIVPDVNFELEDERTLACLRVTPFRDIPGGGRVGDWGRVERAMAEVFGGKVTRSGENDLLRRDELHTGRPSPERFEVFKDWNGKPTLRDRIGGTEDKFETMDAALAARTRRLA